MNRRDGLKLMFAAPFALAHSSRFAATGSWKRVADMPLATQEIYPALHNGEIIIAGGIASKAGVPYFTNRCIAYCPGTDAWREHSELPEPRHHAALITASSRLFMIGGFNGGYSHIWRMRDTVLEFADGQWIPAGTLPQKQAEGVIATSPHGRIHVVTGQSPRGEGNIKRSDHGEIHSHWSWTPGNAQWQEHAPIPTARNSATGGWVGDQLVVAGGRTSKGNLDTLEIYSLKDDSWRSAQPMPLPQAGTASVIIDDGLIVFGGEIFTPQSGVFKEVWRYRLGNDSWHALESLPTPRHGLGAVRVGDNVYVTGGATRPGGSGTSNIVEVYDIKEL